MTGGQFKGGISYSNVSDVSLTLIKTTFSLNSETLQFILRKTRLLLLLYIITKLNF